MYNPSADLQDRVDLGVRGSPVRLPVVHRGPPALPDGHAQGSGRGGHLHTEPHLSLSYHLQPELSQVSHQVIYMHNPTLVFVTFWNQNYLR